MKRFLLNELNSENYVEKMLDKMDEIENAQEAEEDSEQQLPSSQREGSPARGSETFSSIASPEIKNVHLPTVKEFSEKSGKESDLSFKYLPKAAQSNARPVEKKVQWSSKLQNE